MLGPDATRFLKDNPASPGCYEILKKANGDDWLHLLCDCSALSIWADRFNWRFTSEWVGKAYSQNWEKLICAHIQYADKVDLNTLNEDSLANILKRWSNLARKVDLAKHGGKVSALVLNSDPDVVHKVRFEEFGSNDWRDFLVESIRIIPEAIIKCNWRIITNEDLVAILSSKPECAKHITDKQWRKFSAQQWVTLCDEQPQFQEQFDKFANSEVKREVALIMRDSSH